MRSLSIFSREFKLVLAGLALLPVLHGCALAPGMDMKAGDGDVSEVNVPVLRDGKPTTEKVKVQPITAELLIEKEAARNQGAGELSLPTAAAGKAYSIGPRDRLLITVWEHPELNDPGGEKIEPGMAGKEVQEDGTLFYPYVGTVQVAGRSVPEVRELLTRELSKYFKKVKLDVRVISYLAHKVYVVGEVKNPGIQSMVDSHLTVAEAISRAGGAMPEADLSGVTLSRGDKLYPIDVLALYERGGNGHNLALQDGDVLNIPDRRDNKVFVMGEVGRQNALQINKGRMTLAQALSETGGMDFNSSKADAVYVIRGAQPKPEIFHLDGESPDSMILADRFRLQPHDVVYVGTAGVTRWSRVLNQLLPSSMSNIMSKSAFMGI